MWDGHVYNVYKWNSGISHKEEKEMWEKKIHFFLFFGIASFSLCMSIDSLSVVTG